jgi:hypothetical protein
VSEKVAETLVSDRWETLSKELKVAVRIYKLNEAGEIPYFSSLAKGLEESDGLSSTTVHNALDHLIDLGTIKADWTKVDTRWVRRFIISGESKDFIRKIANELYR